jgi:hypothetical protein
MKKHLLITLIICSIALTACGGVETEAEPQVIIEVDYGQRIKEAVETMKMAQSFEQSTDFEMSMTFNEEMIEADETGILKNMMLSMEDIQFSMDYIFENYDYTNPLGNDDFKAYGDIWISMAEEDQHIEMYFADQNVYMREGEGEFMYTPIDENSEDFDLSQLDLSNYIMDELDYVNAKHEDMTLEVQGKQMALTRYSFENVDELIEEIIANDEMMGNVVNGENPMEGISFENMIYNIYVSEDKQLVKVEIKFDMGMPEDMKMFGIEKVSYAIDVGID